MVQNSLGLLKNKVNKELCNKRRPGPIEKIQRKGVAVNVVFFKHKCFPKQLVDQQIYWASQQYGKTVK